MSADSGEIVVATGTWQRTLIAVVQVLGLATWFSASAVVPSLQDEWEISLAAAVWLTASTQVGFVLGAVASSALNLADRLPPAKLLAVSAAGAAICTSALAFGSNGLDSAIPLRLLTGVFLAGVYPVGMKLMASWTVRAQRGLWFGILIGALTLGSSVPHLIGTLALPWREVLLTAAGLTASGAILAAIWLRPGPYLSASAARLDPRFALRMFRRRGPRLVNIGYFGHMWELYALWTWFPTFLAVTYGEPAGSSHAVGMWVFLTMGLSGVVGCLVGGWAADRWGRGRTATVALAVSGACCIVSPVIPHLGVPLGVVIGAIWGAAVIADSGVFSTMLSERVEPEFAGTALTTQTAVGFAITIVTIQIVPVIAGVLSWNYSLVILAIGPIAGVIALHRLGDRRIPVDP